MNLAQMQMEYGHAPNGKVVLVQARPQILLQSRMAPRDRQGRTRALKSDYAPRRMRASHDSQWK